MAIVGPQVFYGFIVSYYLLITTETLKNRKKYWNQGPNGGDKAPRKTSPIIDLAITAVIT